MIARCRWCLFVCDCAVADAVVQARNSAYPTGLVSTKQQRLGASVLYRPMNATAQEAMVHTVDSGWSGGPFTEEGDNAVM